MTLLRDTRQVLMNPPCEVRFEGWVSDTVTLGRHGWEFFHDIDHARMEDWIFIKNSRLKLGGISDPYFVTRDALHGIGGRSSRPCIHIQMVAHNPQHNTIYVPEAQIVKASLDSRGFQPVDYQPRVVEMKNLNELFEQGAYTKQETIVEEADMDVVEMLQSIVEKQAPKQKELRFKRAKLEKQGQTDEKTELKLVMLK